MWARRSTTWPRRDALRAFGLGYLCHLAADTVAHNYFVPRQLMITSSTAAVGHSYWEARVESHLGDAYAKSAKDVILLKHAEADAHLDRIISPTIFSVRTNRRLFRGMVHLTESSSWQRATQVAREYSRWPLTDDDVERHLGMAYDYMVELLGGDDTPAHQLDPSGERPLKMAKELRRRVLRDSGRRNTARLETAALEHFGLPDRPLSFWTRVDDTAAVAGAGERRALAARARERRPLNPDEVVRRLGLRPHPEGGFYGETFRSPLRLTLPDGRQRSASTAIHYLLPSGAWSTWHRVRADEVWHHYDGGALRLYRLGAGAGAARPADAAGGGARRSVAGGRARGRCGALRLHGRAGVRVRGLRDRIARGAGGGVSVGGRAHPAPGPMTWGVAGVVVALMAGERLDLRAQAVPLPRRGTRSPLCSHSRPCRHRLRAAAWCGSS